MLGKMAFKARKSFRSDKEYGDYVKGALQVGMTVICMSGYEQIKAGDIGTVIKIQVDDAQPDINVLCDWMNKGGGYWVKFSDVHVMGFHKTENIKINDWVRVRHYVMEPTYGWGKVKRTSIGVVLALSEDKQYLTIDFPEDGIWKGCIGDMERVPKMHPCVKCQVCKDFPLAGARYSCSKCDVFDLCATCFKQTKDHKHDFNKIACFGAITSNVGQPGKPELTRTRSVKEIWWPDIGSQQGGGTQVSQNRGAPQCSYYVMCRRFFKTLNLPDEYFEFGSDQCFCTNCHMVRKDKDFYIKGDPPKKYVLPIGWVKFGLGTPPRAQAINVFKNWHVGFHGTVKESIHKILETGDLLLPGDVTIYGNELAIPKNHYDPDNPDMKPPSGHDVKKVYLSPSMKYSGCDVYARKTEFADPITGRSYQARVAFQARIKPDSYLVGSETIGAKAQVDPHIPNDALEWSTNRRGAIILTGLLVKVEGVGPGTIAKVEILNQPKK